MSIIRSEPRKTHAAATRCILREAPHPVKKKPADFSAVSDGCHFCDAGVIIQTVEHAETDHRFSGGFSERFPCPSRKSPPLAAGFRIPKAGQNL
jgi:hypothetical protein